VKQHHTPAQTVLTCQQVTTENEYKLCRKAKKFIHVTHILYHANDQQSPVFLALSRVSMQN
jgi:hypothetical protein